MQREGYDFLGEVQGQKMIYVQGTWNKQMRCSQALVELERPSFGKRFWEFSVCTGP